MTTLAITNDILIADTLTTHFPPGKPPYTTTATKIELPNNPISFTNAIGANLQLVAYVASGMVNDAPAAFKGVSEMLRRGMVTAPGPKDKISFPIVGNIASLSKIVIFAILKCEEDPSKTQGMKIEFKEIDDTGFACLEGLELVEPGYWTGGSFDIGSILADEILVKYLGVEECSLELKFYVRAYLDPYSNTALEYVSFRDESLKIKPLKLTPADRRIFNRFKKWVVEHYSNK